MIEHEELNQLLKPAKEEYLVSIYIPTHRAGVVEQKEDKTRFKNQVDIAEDDLKQLGVREKDRTAYLKPAHELLRDELFWRHQKEGLAVFLARDSHTWHKLPEPVSEITVTSYTYHVKPLLFLPDPTKTFYILAMSPSSVRLLKAGLETAEVMEVPDMPQNITEALPTKERQPTQQHTVAGGGGRGKAVFHGHGGLKDYKETELKKFVRAVSKSVDAVMQSSEIPMVFAGDEELMGLYRATNKKANMLEAYLHGNYDEMSEQDLHEAAFPLVEQYFRDNPRPVLSEFYHVLANEPERVRSELAAVIYAACEGKVAELLLANDMTVWGNVSPDYEIERLSERAPGAVDLLNVAARETYRHNGNIHRIGRDSIPEQSNAAAILRH